MAFKALTQQGKNFIEKICTKQTPEGELFSGTNGVLPHSDPPVNKTWTASVKISNKFFTFLEAVGDSTGDIYNWVKNPDKFRNQFFTTNNNVSSDENQFQAEKEKYIVNTITDKRVEITTNKELSDAIISIVNYYSIIYELDANIIAAQLYVESAFKLWVYPKNSTASGISQFTMPTIYGIGISNRIKGVEPFTNAEKEKLKNGLNIPNDPESYNARTNRIARENRPVLHQNFIDNIDLMIKIQCRYMAHIATQTKSLASSTLLGYSRGPAYALNTYSKSVNKLIRIEKKRSSYTNEGLNYVKKIFNLLGDSFGYFKREYIGVDGNTHIFDMSKPFEIYETTVSESDEFEINVESVETYEKNGDIVPLAVIEQNKFPYSTVRFPETQYRSGSGNKQNNKNQLVLHHTVSGPLVNGDLYTWQNKGDRVATAFVISRKGEIYQVFNSHFWAVHLFFDNKPFELAEQKWGLKFPTQQRETLEMKSIGIELDSWGGLTQNSNGEWTNAYDEVIDPTEYPVQIYSNGYRNYFGFEKYTTRQINATKALILALHDRWDFPLDYNENMWEFNEDAINRKSGIWSHVSFRPDKSDCHPQPELINMLKSLNG